MKRILYLASMAICAALLPVIGTTQSDEPAFTQPSPMVGTWSFETTPYRGDTCVMSGHMNIRPTQTTDVFTCSFTAKEDCTGQDTWVVEQTCKAIKRDDTVRIKSTIVNFLEAKEYTDSYAPDHFALKVESRELMTGSLISALTAPVEFRRNPDNLS